MQTIYEKSLILFLFTLSVLFIVPKSIPSNHVTCYMDPIVNLLPRVDLEKLNSLQVIVVLLVDANYFVMGYCQVMKSQKIRLPFQNRDFYAKGMGLGIDKGVIRKVGQTLFRFFITLAMFYFFKIALQRFILFERKSYNFID